MRLRQMFYRVCYPVARRKFRSLAPATERAMRDELTPNEWIALDRDLRDLDVYVPYIMKRAEFEASRAMTDG